VQSYLGIDAGGSGSRWALLAADGAFRSRGDDGPSIQVAEIGAAVAAGRVAELLQSVATREQLPVETPVVVGLAGVAGGTARQELEQRLSIDGRNVRIVEDTITGAAAALADGPGVAVFAGTGSFAVARDAEGRLHRVGGRGSIASDHGSGFRVVRDAADAALLAADGMMTSSTLCEVLPEAFGVASVESLGLALKTSTTRDIARCFPVIVGAAAAGDAAASAVLRDGSSALSRLALAVAQRAGLDLSSCTVTLGGGTMRAEYYFNGVQDALAGARFEGVVRGLPVAAEQGAAYLARAFANGEPPLSGWVEN
jgi:N-acetylglucosamine kinase-like BadF-type ATPase